METSGYATTVFISFDGKIGNVKFVRMFIRSHTSTRVKTTHDYSHSVSGL